MRYMWEERGKKTEGIEERARKIDPKHALLEMEPQEARLVVNIHIFFEGSKSPMNTSLHSRQRRCILCVHVIFVSKHLSSLRKP